MQRKSVHPVYRDITGYASVAHNLISGTRFYCYPILHQPVYLEIAIREEFIASRILLQTIDDNFTIIQKCVSRKLFHYMIYYWYYYYMVTFTFS